MSQNQQKTINPTYTIDRVVIDPLQTTDATVTVAYSFPVNQNQGVRLKINGVATNSGFTAVVSHTDFVCTFLRGTGNVARTSVSDTSGVTGGIQGTFVIPQPLINAVANTGTQSIDVTVTGKAATTINWNLQIELNYTN